METFKCYTCGGIFPGTLAPFATKCNICTQTQIMREQFEQSQQSQPMEQSTSYSSYSGTTYYSTRDILLWWAIFLTLSIPSLYWLYIW